MRNEKTPWTGRLCVDNTMTSFLDPACSFLITILFLEVLSIIQSQFRFEMNLLALEFQLILCHS